MTLTNYNPMAEKMTLEEIKIAGMQALFQHLGAVGMVRFLQQFNTGWGDYTTDREVWLNQDEAVRAVAERIVQQRAENKAEMPLTEIPEQSGS